MGILAWVGYRMGARLGSGMAGQRAQLDEWYRAGRYPVQAADLRDMETQRWQEDARVREVDAQRRAQADILRSYDQPTVRGWNYTDNRRCTNPNCWCGQ